MIQMTELVDEYMNTVLITLFYIFKERLSILCGDINDFMTQIKTFVFIQDMVTEAGFTLRLKTVKMEEVYEATVLKTLGVRQQRADRK